MQNIVLFCEWASEIRGTPWDGGEGHFEEEINLILKRKCAIFNEWKYVIPFILLIQEGGHYAHNFLLNKKKDEKEK